VEFEECTLERAVRVLKEAVELNEQGKKGKSEELLQNDGMYGLKVCFKGGRR